MMHGGLENDVQAQFDLPDVGGGIDVPDFGGIPDVPDVPDFGGIPDVPDVPDFGDIPDAPEAPNLPEIPDVPDFDFPSYPDVPDYDPGDIVIDPGLPDFDEPSIPDIPDFDAPEFPDIGVPNIPDVPSIPDGLGWWPDTGTVIPDIPIPEVPENGPWFPGLDSGIGGVADWFEGAIDWSVGGTGNFIGDSMEEMWSVFGSMIGQFFQGTGAPDFAEGAMTKSMILFGGIAIVGIAAYVVV